MHFRRRRTSSSAILKSSPTTITTNPTSSSLAATTTSSTQQNTSMNTLSSYQHQPSTNMDDEDENNANSANGEEKEGELDRSNIDFESGMSTVFGDEEIIFDESCAEGIGGSGGREDDDEEGNTDRDALGSSSSSSIGTEGSGRYDWRKYVPSTGNICHFFRWLMVGGSVFAEPLSDDDLLSSLAGLARCLILMRKYLDEHGMPTKGGIRDQEYVLREVVRDLYAGGTPLWALESVMQKAAEGLTGQANVNWQLFPRKAFIYSPGAGTTSMFNIVRGYNMRKLDAMEKVAVRLASFASNIQGVSNVPARFPNPKEFTRAARTESVRNLSQPGQDSSKLAHRILKLASKQQGLFYYTNSAGYRGSGMTPMNSTVSEEDDDDDSTAGTGGGRKKPTAFAKKALAKKPRPTLHNIHTFWVVTDEERELFSRLAAMEAMKAIDEIDKKETALAREHKPWMSTAFRVCGTAGACGFWFGGSWWDMVVAGGLGVLVNYIGTSNLLSKQERLVYEVVASFVVGLTAGLVALTWPDQTCFAAMALSGILDLLQGFRVVYAIIEIMSKHTVSGGADLLEGILFTGLIAYFLRFGQYVAAASLGDYDSTDFGTCTNGINQYWYILFVPLAALSWAGLFTPIPADVIPMAFHGVLSYAVNFSLAKAGFDSELNNFVSATVVSFSAGVLSRFTGRQAVGNTVSGIYFLLPGAYLVTSIYQTNIDGSFFMDIVTSAIVIGIGAWTGTILCSPTLLGTTRGLIWQKTGKGGSGVVGKSNLRQLQTSERRQYRDDDSQLGKSPTQTMLYF